jgi:putative phosphoesterase
MEKKIAVISDIHGNHSALKAVLNRIDEESNVEHIYCLGDLIGIGYETNEVLERLFSRNDISFVLGNHDEAILDIIAGREPYSEGKEREHHKWIASRMDSKFIKYLSKIPTKMLANYNGKNFLFVHYHLNDSNEFIKVDKEPTAEKLDSHYRNTDVDVICFGHHHVIHYFKSKERIYLNPSSLGCYHKPLAPYATITVGEIGEVTVSFHEVPYNNTDFLLGYKRLNVPDSDFILNVFHGNQHLK